MTTKTLTTQQRIALLRHLAAGKTPDIVAAIVGITRSEVVDIASHHGFPSTDRMTRAIELLEAKLQEDEIPAGSVTSGVPLSENVDKPRTAVAGSTAVAVPLAKPDEIRALIDIAKSHPSKRIQAACFKLLDDVDRLRGLIRADEEKHAAARKAAAAKAAARAEVERLERQLAEAKAKLRGVPAKSKASPSESSPPTEAAQVRAWAADNGLECPRTGRIPRIVYEAFTAAQDGAA